MVFGPNVKKYLQENNLSLEAYLAHTPYLEDDIFEYFKFIMILYLPPDTTPNLYHTARMGISNFRKILPSSCSVAALR